MSTISEGARDRRGDWQPDQPIATPPVFVWPPRPRAFLKWLFGFPGYFWPWNLAYAAVAIATWLWATPALSRMATFQVDWIAFIFVRNLVLMTLIYSAWHLRLFVQKAQGRKYKYNGRWLATNNPNFLFRNQLRDNIFWSVVSGCTIWTAYEVVTWWAYANGLLPFVDLQTNPVYFVLLMCAVPMMREVHFYLIHRALHWKPIYKTVHYLHHRNVNVGPWSGLSMHPVEHLAYFSGVLLHWVIPSHPVHAMFHLHHLAFSPAPGHTGFEEIVIKGNTTLKNHHYFHYLHHRYFECNYGGDGAVPLDRWFGTFHDGSEQAQVAMDARAMRAAAR